MEKIMLSKEFIVAKEKALRSLNKAMSEQQTDKNIESLLKLINKLDFCYTSSSCEGRTVLLEIPTIGNKKEAKFLGKWHGIVDKTDIKKASENAKKGLLWILAQSPVFHIGCNDINIADKLLKTSIASGFKNSGLKSIGRKIVLEICSTERLDSPVGKDGILFCNDDYLQFLIEISNEIFKVSKAKINRFEGNLLRNFV